MDTIRSCLRFLFVFVVLLYALLLLVGPRVDDAEQRKSCVQNVYLPGPFGLSLNCDSPEFLRLAASPSRLLEAGNVRQSRPGLPLAVHLLSQPFVIGWDAISGVFRDIPRSGYSEEEEIAAEIEKLAPFFLGYLVVNALLLYACLALYHACLGLPRVLSRDSLRNPASWFGLLLVANPITKDYLWSPHTQVFNILVPLVCLYGVMLALGGWRNTRGVLAVSAFSGLGALFYGSFVVVAPAMALAFFVRPAFPSLDLRDVWKKLGVVAGMGALAVAPMAIWVGYVVATTGNFYSHEVHAYRQIVWIGDLFESHGVRAVVYKLAWYMNRMVSGAWAQGWWVLPVGATLLVLRMTLSTSGQGKSRESDGLVLAGILVSLLFGLFFSAVGKASLRIAYSMLPPLIVVLGHWMSCLWASASPRVADRIHLSVVLLMCGIMLNIALSDAPYSR